MHSVLRDCQMTIPPSWLLACPFMEELIVRVRASHSHLSAIDMSSSRVAGLPFPGGDVELFPPHLWYWLACRKCERWTFRPSVTFRLAAWGRLWPVRGVTFPTGPHSEPRIFSTRFPSALDSHKLVCAFIVRKHLCLCATKRQAP